MGHSHVINGGLGSGVHILKAAEGTETDGKFLKNEPPGCWSGTEAAGVEPRLVNESRPHPYSVHLQGLMLQLDMSTQNLTRGTFSGTFFYYHNTTELGDPRKSL